MKLLKIKQDEAQDRQQDYNKLTPQQKLDKLDKQLGKGVGALKQRAKLLAQIQGTRK